MITPARTNSDRAVQIRRIPQGARAIDRSFGGDRHDVSPGFAA
jgi:hypothetical protein